jgi:hypothetical protein
LNTPTRIPSIIALSGWLFGIASAGYADYQLLPYLFTRFGGRRLGALAIGLVVGIGLMWAWVELTRRLAERLLARAERANEASGEPGKVRKTPAEQMPLASRILIAVLALLIIVGMIMSSAPLPTFRAP